jgi:hypothetical protein
MEREVLMSLKGATALVRLAQNPRCEVLGAMVMQEGPETRFFERVVGEPYGREYGERQSSKRRGTQFERNAYAGDARLLREALAPAIGLAPDEIRVRNLLDDYPGTKDDARVARLRITRQLLADSLAGRQAPHLIIQPQLLVPTNPGPRPYFFIAPDVLAWSQQHGVYVPADLKSFIVRENEVSRADLARVRLQLGAQSLALMHEYDRLDRGKTEVPATGLLIFSHPNGLRPHEPRTEDLRGARDAVRAGIEAFLRHRRRIDGLRAGAEPYTVAAELAPHFEEACLAHCVMSEWCRSSVAGHARDLGDAPGRLLGNLALERVAGFLLGTLAPSNDAERGIAAELRRIALEQGVRAA